MQPIKITFLMERPVIEHNDRPLHLDALLSAARARDLELAGDEDAWDRALDLSDVLERDACGVWKASWLVPQAESGHPSLVEQHILVRRSGLAGSYYEALARGDFTQKAGEKWGLDGGSGQYKGFLVPLQVRHVRAFEAWAVGDAEGVQRLLAHIPAIGKVLRNGYGRIASVTVEPAPEQPEHWRFRTLPHGADTLAGVTYADVQATITAPYWKRARRVHAIEPLELPS